MAIVTIAYARRHLSKLVARAEAGEEIIIARNKSPVVRLATLRHTNRKRVSGLLKGRINLPDDFFFVPLEANDLRAWEGVDP
jgi:prevent-host-death family protein